MEASKFFFPPSSHVKHAEVGNLPQLQGNCGGANNSETGTAGKKNCFTEENPFLNMPLYCEETGKEREKKQTPTCNQTEWWDASILPFNLPLHHGFSFGNIMFFASFNQLEEEKCFFNKAGNHLDSVWCQTLSFFPQKKTAYDNITDQGSSPDCGLHIDYKSM